MPGCRENCGARDAICINVAHELRLPHPARAAAMSGPSRSPSLPGRDPLEPPHQRGRGRHSPGAIRRQSGWRGGRSRRELGAAQPTRSDQVSYLPRDRCGIVDLRLVARTLERAGEEQRHARLVGVTEVLVEVSRRAPPRTTQQLVDDPAPVRERPRSIADASASAGHDATGSAGSASTFLNRRRDITPPAGRPGRPRHPPQTARAHRASRRREPGTLQRRPTSHASAPPAPYSAGDRGACVYRAGRVERVRRPSPSARNPVSASRAPARRASRRSRGAWRCSRRRAGWGW
jgi:hypothetical protein